MHEKTNARRLGDASLASYSNGSSNTEVNNGTLS